jgi:hypothetical protein
MVAFMAELLRAVSKNTVSIKAMDEFMCAIERSY